MCRLIIALSFYSIQYHIHSCACVNHANHPYAPPQSAQSNDLNKIKFCQNAVPNSIFFLQDNSLLEYIVRPWYGTYNIERKKEQHQRRLHTTIDSIVMPKIRCSKHIKRSLTIHRYRHHVSLHLNAACTTCTVYSTL